MSPRLPIASILIGILFGCSGGNSESDAYGNFEATEVLISSEASGRIVELEVREGSTLSPGAFVGLIDTTQAVLHKRQLEARRRAVRSRIAQVLAEIQVLQEQRSVLETESRRVQNLLEADAATGKQRDDIDGQIRVTERRIESIRTQNASILAEIEALDAQIAQVEDQRQKSRIVNPIRGTVLDVYAERHEVTAPGKPLYKIANLDTLELRAYVSGGQLADLRLGDEVSVLFDQSDDALASRTGRVSWISSRAEFTPKMVQTREERVSQVYAFTVRVPNADGALKIGMPGEVVIGADTHAQ